MLRCFLGVVNGVTLAAVAAVLASDDRFDQQQDMRIVSASATAVASLVNTVTPAGQSNDGGKDYGNS